MLHTTPYFPEYNEQRLKEVREHPFFADTRREIAEAAEYWLTHDPAHRKFSEMHMFATVGDRSVYGAAVTTYVERFNNLYWQYLITEDEKWLEPLADSIWDLCDFESWSDYAHVKEDHPIEQRRGFLDLFACQMGLCFAELLVIMGDKLPDLVRRRLEYEVRTRIIDSFRDHHFGWEGGGNNWSTVCGGSVLGTYCYLASREETEAVLPRLMGCVKHYLDGFDEDGCCQEGYGYWKYGFTYLCYFASFLRVFTNGEQNLFADPKVRRIAEYQDHISLDDTHCIAFADATSFFNPSVSLTHFLKSEYPDLVIPSFTRAKCAFKYELRTIFWQNANLANAGNLRRHNYYFKDLQQIIAHRKTYSVAAKGGSNAEFHNHNDIGSFMISKNGTLTVSECHGGTYTRQYFSSERYNYLNASSRSHSVPIINGKLQRTTDKKCVAYREEPYAFEIGMEQAYDEPTLQSLRRFFDIGEDALTVCDTYVFTEPPTSVVERFVSESPFEMKEPGTVLAGPTVLHYDADAWDATFTSEAYEVGDNLCYQFNLTAKNPKKEMTFALIAE